MKSQWLVLTFTLSIPSVLGCGAAPSDGGSERANQGPPGPVSQQSPSATTLHTETGEVRFVDVNNHLLLAETFDAKTGVSYLQQMVDSKSSPLELYMALARDTSPAPPEFLVKIHQRVSSQPPVAMPRPGIGGAKESSLHIQSAMGTFNGCTVSWVEHIGSVGIPSPNSYLLVTPPNSFGNSTQWVSTRDAPQRYSYLACAPNSTANIDLWMKPHSGGLPWMYLPDSVSGNTVFYVLQATAWDGGDDSGGGNIDIWSVTNPYNQVIVEGRVADQ